MSWLAIADSTWWPLWAVSSFMTRARPSLENGLHAPKVVEHFASRRVLIFILGGAPGKAGACGVNRLG